MKEWSESLGPADPRWQAALDGLPHDCYHLPAYTALTERHPDLDLPVLDEGTATNETEEVTEAVDKDGDED